MVSEKPLCFLIRYRFQLCQNAIQLFLCLTFCLVLCNHASHLGYRWRLRQQLQRHLYLKLLEDLEKQLVWLPMNAPLRSKKLSWMPTSLERQNLGPDL